LSEDTSFVIFALWDTLIKLNKDDKRFVGGVFNKAGIGGGHGTQTAGGGGKFISGSGIARALYTAL
jgi:hypothetical protein